MNIHCYVMVRKRSAFVSNQVSADQKPVVDLYLKSFIYWNFYLSSFCKISLEIIISWAAIPVVSKIEIFDFEIMSAKSSD